MIDRRSAGWARALAESASIQRRRPAAGRISQNLTIKQRLGTWVARAASAMPGSAPGVPTSNSGVVRVAVEDTRECGPPVDAPVVETRTDVEFSYAGDDRYVYSIPAGLTLKRGRIYTLNGVSGSGKSTLLTMLACLRRFLRGSICFNFPGSRVEVDGDSWHRSVGPGLWSNIGFAFQRPELIRALTIEQNLGVALNGSNAVRERLFDPEEWDSIRHSQVWNISGGQTQRVGVARAFGPGQSLVILDEPTNNLDRSRRDAMAKAVTEQRSDRAILVVSHDSEFLDLLPIDVGFTIAENAPANGRILRQLLAEPEHQNMPQQKEV